MMAWRPFRNRFSRPLRFNDARGRTLRKQPRLRLWLERLEDRTAPAISISSLTNPAVFGEAVTFTGTAATAGDSVSIEDVTSGVTVLATGAARHGSSGRDFQLTIPVGDVGGHAIRAHDTTNGDVSPTLSQVVNRGDTTTAIAESPLASLYGQTVTFTAILHATPPAIGLPTGTVAFSEGSAVLGTGTVDSSGHATFTTAELSAGIHSVHATYGGDSRFVGSSSGNWALSVQTPTAVTVTSSPNPSEFGQLVAFTITVTATTPGAPTPAGLLTLREGATVLATEIGLDAAAQAVFGTSGLSIGSHTITASYAGAGVFLASSGSDATSPQVVGQTGTATSISVSPDPSDYGQAVTLTAAVAHLPPGFGIPSGTTTFLEDSTVLGTGTLGGTGHATFSTSSLAAGVHSVHAAYAGDAQFTGSVSGSYALTIDTPTAVSVTTSPSPSVFGQLVTILATVTATTPGAPTPEGFVSFSEGGTVLAAHVGLSGAGRAIFGTTGLSIGSHTLTVNYLGAGLFHPSAGDNRSNPQVVDRAATATDIGGGPILSDFHQAVTLTATVGVLSPGAGTPTGIASFREGGSVLGTGSFDATGKATFSTTALSAGYHTVTTSYDGDAQFTGSASGNWDLEVKTLTTTAVTSAPSPTVFGQYASITATVSANASYLGTPFGAVTFREGSKILAANVPLSGGQAILSTAGFPVGSHTITASYIPTNIYMASSGSDAGAPQVVVRNTTWTEVTSSASPSARGQAVTLIATVVARPPGFGTPSGLVTFRDGGAVLATQPLDANGRATLSTASLAVGNHVITASYSGDQSVLGSSGSDVDFPQVVEANASTTTVTSSPNPAAPAQTVTFTATVTSTGGVPTGSVDFTDAPGAPGAGTPTQIWLAPNLNSDTMALFQRPQDWQAARSHVTVLKLGEVQFGTNPPDWLANSWQRLQTVNAVKLLKAWNIALAIDAGVIKAQYLADPTVAVRDAQTAITNAAAAGGQVKYVSMDEPYYGGSISFAHFPPTTIADRVSTFMRTITSNNPSVQVGEIEPYPSIDVPTIESFVNALIARGTKPAFFHIDLDFGFINSNAAAAAKMRVDMPILRDFFAKLHIPFGIIFWSDTVVPASDQDYSTFALHNVDVLKAAMGAPVQSIFQSWVPNRAGDLVFPQNVPETQPFTHTWLIDQAWLHLNSTTLASQVPLLGGRATFTISTLARGNHTITASYSGDINFVASTGRDSSGSQIINSAADNSRAISTIPSSLDRTSATLSPPGQSPSAMGSTLLTLVSASDEFFALAHADRLGGGPRLLRRVLSEDDWLQPLF
jgi:Bacterial Ig-like domain (group 3)